MFVIFWFLILDIIIGLRLVFYLMKFSWDIYLEYWVLLYVYVVIFNIISKIFKDLRWDGKLNVYNFYIYFSYRV